jgi:hypothetical protein
MAKYSFLDDIEATPLFKYYEKHGENRAAAAALSKLRMEYGLARKMAMASIKVGGHIKGGNASVRTGVQKRNGYKTISKLLEWQKHNNFRVCDLERTDEWKSNISKAHIGKKLSKETIEKLREKKTLFGTKDAWNKGLSGYTTQPHSEETKQKMRERATGKIITDKQKADISKKLSIPILCYKYPSMEFYKEYSSQKYAKNELGLTGILHVLKGRNKQCGGYYFEYKK